ncbi:hypothetical protein KSW81_000709 [Nannochloris sp. 'desiccata']|nr:hypothetical protein KSW81_000709 [Chlorella desiccata (nom. nud.)]
MVAGAHEDIDYNAHCTWVNVEYLSQGLSAPCIHKALNAAKEDVVAGHVTEVNTLRAHIASAIELGGGKIDYVQIVNALTLKPMVGEIVVGGEENKNKQEPMLIAVAAHFGKVRLIDNVDF